GSRGVMRNMDSIISLEERSVGLKENDGCGRNLHLCHLSMFALVKLDTDQFGRACKWSAKTRSDSCKSESNLMVFKPDQQPGNAIISKKCFTKIFSERGYIEDFVVNQDTGLLIPRIAKTQ